MASLQSRISDLITAIGTDVKSLSSYLTLTRQTTSITSSSTPAPTGYAMQNQEFISALAAAATFSAPSGTLVDGNALVIRMKDNGTARALTWNSVYRSLDTTNAPLPTTTVAGKWMYLGFMYNATDSKWDLIAVLKQT